jgi:hypothetical protein
MPKNSLSFATLITVGAEKYYSSHPFMNAEENSDNVVRQKKLMF